jgi:hypothetical protein
MRSFARGALAAVAAVSVAAGCGSDSPPVQGDAATPDAPVGEHYLFVVSEVRLPTSQSEAQLLGLDIDGDPAGAPDNKLGEILFNLTTLGNFEPQENFDQFIANGVVIQLFDLQATEFEAGASALRGFLGRNPVPSPCISVADPVCGRHLDGAGSFSVDLTAPLGTVMAGPVTSGRLENGPGEMPLYLPLMEGRDPLVVTLVGSRVDATVSPDGMSGRLGGALRVEEIDAVVFPEIHAIVAAQIAADCNAGVCPGGSNGQALLDLFDANGDGMVSLEELRESQLISNLFAPDIDLYDGEGFFNPRIDGVNDSLSLGVSFTAVPASFPIPN